MLEMFVGKDDAVDGMRAFRVGEGARREAAVDRSISGRQLEVMPAPTGAQIKR